MRKNTHTDGNDKRTLVCLAKSVLGIDYGSFLERMTEEYAIERKIIADRVETQERREPHKEEAPAS